MKTKIFAFLATVAFGGASGALAVQPANSTSPVTVEFLEPENYTDFRTSEFGGNREQAGLEHELRREIQRIAVRHLPPGYHLNLRFRDIDMAGEFEPWHGPRFSDVRIVREIYPPRMDVEYSITNDAGEVVASGTRKLSDINYLWRLRMRTDDQFSYENELLNDFIRDISRSVS
ncbi:MAG TPA: DUF3016 domain-containing protein [Opitutaceae bacterium]